jgi:hypothetical protein
MPFASALDRALMAPSMRGDAPSASAVVRERDGARLDALASALESAELPLPHPSAVEAPRPLAPLLRADDLRPLTHANPAGVDARFDGLALRLLIEGLMCTLDASWEHASCRTVPEGALRLAHGDHDAALVVYSDADGDGAWVDATTGQRVWRPRDPSSQALVKKSGATTVLHRERIGELTEQRVVQLWPGKPPASKRLAAPREARALLLPDAALAWFSIEDRDVLYAQSLLKGSRWLGPRRELGALPRGARHVSDCGDAVLFASDAQHALLMRERIFELGALEGTVDLSCQRDTAVVLARRGDALKELRCNAGGCKSVDSAATAVGASLAIGALGSKVIVLWGDPLRMRIAKAGELAEASDALLLDDAAHGGIDVRRARLLPGVDAALALVEAKSGRLYMVRIGASGSVAPLKHAVSP